jgi:DNA primase catalytic core
MAGKEDILEIKTRLDVVTVLSQYMELKRAGKTWMGLCPFHNERTPSFHVNPQLGIYKCFGCGKTGDIFTFVQDYEHVDFVEALEKLAQQAGITLTRSRDDAHSKEMQGQRKMHELVDKFFQHLLLTHPVGKEANSYAFEKRGLTQESIEKYHIGYAPKAGFEMIKFLAKRGFSLKEAYTAGLVNEKQKDKFTDRLMFGISDTSGRIVGFSGRVIRSDDERPKYLNSPETLIFKKRLILFGFFQAKQAIAQADMAIMCEGQLDVISAAQAGVQNIIAPLGTGLTDTQLLLVKRLTPNITFAFDNDAAGKKSLLRGVEMALSLGMHPFILTIPSQFKDIDELVKADPELWKQVASSPKDFFEESIKGLEIVMKKDFQLFEKKLQQLLEVIAHAQDLKRALLIKEIAQRLHIDESVLTSSIQGKVMPEQLQQGMQQRQGAVTTAEYVLSMMLQFPLFALFITKKDGGERYFLTDVQKKLYVSLHSFALAYKEFLDTATLPDGSQKNWNSIATEFYTAIGSTYVTYIQNVQEDPDLGVIIQKLGTLESTMKIEVTEDVVKDFQNAALRLKKSVITLKIQEMRDKLGAIDEEADPDRADELGKDLQKYFMALKKLESQ